MTMERVTIYENVPMTQRGGTEMDAIKTWAKEKADEIGDDSATQIPSEVSAAAEEALLEADKNGYERGRKETVEDISDVISEHQDESELEMVRAVVRYIDKASLALRKTNGQ